MRVVLPAECWTRLGADSNTGLDIHGWCLDCRYILRNMLELSDGLLSQQQPSIAGIQIFQFVDYHRILWSFAPSVFRTEMTHEHISLD